MNVKIILQVAYMSAFRPSFCLNGSFARVFKIFSHRQTDTHTHTHTHGTDHSTPAQARGNYIYMYNVMYKPGGYKSVYIQNLNLVLTCT